MVFIHNGFLWLFSAFSFIICSSLFPTGFSSTTSTIAFLFALLIFIKEFRISISYWEVFGLLLFGWLLLSILWSENDLKNSAIFLSEYRFYVMAPVLSYALSRIGDRRVLVFYAICAGLAVSLIASYGLAFGLWKVEGAVYSLGNRIFHGFIMAIFLLICLLLSRENRNHFKAFFGLIAGFILCNILFIENGRTGYIQGISILLLVVFLSSSKKDFFIRSILVIFLIACSYVAIDRFGSRVDQTISNAWAMWSTGALDSSAGHRMEFYRVGLQISLDNIFVGIGIGDLENRLTEMFLSGELKAFTDNLHSEILTMFAVGGLPGLGLFLIWICSLVVSGLKIRRAAPLLGDLLIGVAVIIFVAAVFNSVIKDYGEKHVLLAVLPLLTSYLMCSEGLEKKLLIVLGRNADRRLDVDIGENS